MFRKSDKNANAKEIVEYLLKKLHAYSEHLNDEFHDDSSDDMPEISKESRQEKRNIVRGLIDFLSTAQLNDSTTELNDSTTELTDDQKLDNLKQLMSAEKTIDSDQKKLSDVLESRRAQKDPKTFYELFMNWLHHYTKHSTGAQLVKDIKKHLPAGDAGHSSFPS